MKKLAAALIASGTLVTPSVALAHGHGHCHHGSSKVAYCKTLGSVQDTGASRSNTPSSTPSTAPATNSTSPNQVSSVDSENATRSASPTTSSELPFTGIDIVPLVAGGAALLGAGVAMRRFSGDDK